MKEHKLLHHFVSVCNKRCAGGRKSEAGSVLSQTKHQAWLAIWQIRIGVGLSPTRPTREEQALGYSAKQPSEVSSKQPSEVSSKQPSEVSSKQPSEVSSEVSGKQTSEVCESPTNANQVFTVSLPTSLPDDAAMATTIRCRFPHKCQQEDWQRHKLECKELSESRGAPTQAVKALVF
eukprot:TRINITY_DN2275_c0_g1_i1.p1 TRINITY_DN2275_c0_g1~~TRINITY_DN2275_c0_g1_i1.p1  ORF type:complete len:177 (-),score=29.32 TRINITY_DN2275_c0_g1_i1:474-1004(-)